MAQAVSASARVEDPECGICAYAFNKSTRKPVSCPKCQVVICRDCFQRYSIDHLTIDIMGTTCFSCKEPLSFEFMVANTTKTYINNQWRQKRKEVLVGIEIAKLPATQESVARYKGLQAELAYEEKRYADAEKQIFEEFRIEEDESIDSKIRRLGDKVANYRFKSTNREYSRDERKRYKEKCSKYRERIKALKTKKMELNTVLRNVRYSKYELERFEEQMKRTDDAPADAPDGKSEVNRERRAFIMPCPQVECKGFLSTAYKCGTCEKRICSKCHVNIGEDEHVCNKDDVETVKMVLADTKPCPKCGERISKVNGCDQMWCVWCHTPFSWNTGRAVVGERIHNPEYFRWMRDNNKPIPRVEDQMGGCERMPMAYQLRDVRLSGSDRRSMLYHLYQVYEHLNAHLNVEQTANRDLRVAYLMNKIDKSALERAVITRERVEMKHRFVQNIKRLVVDVLGDFIRKVYRDPSTYDVNITELTNLASYANKELASFQKSHGLKTPRFSENFTSEEFMNECRQ